MEYIQQIQLSSPGKRGQLKVVKVESSNLGLSDVRIRVHYSGLNFADVMMRLGLYPDAPKAPFCPGYEISGVVSEVGTEVKNVKVGDQVLAGVHFGGHSEEVCVPSWQVAHLPSGFSLKEAAAFPVSALTADFALNELSRVRSSDEVMIDCASGALGKVLIEILKDIGVSTIWGLTSKEDKFSEIEKRGAKPLLDRNWQASSYKADVIINSRGGESLTRHRNSLKPLGRMVCLGASHMVGSGKLSYWQVLSEFFAIKKLNPIDLMNENKGVFGLNVLKLFEHPEVLKQSLERMVKLASSGDISVSIDSTFSPDDATKAWDRLANGKTAGKVLFDWN